MSNTEVLQRKCRIVRPCGEIDFASVGDFGAALDAAARETPKGFIVDLSLVTYFDSSGVRAILGAFRHVQRANGRLILLITTEHVRAVISALHLEMAPHLEICDSMDAAERAMAREVSGED